MQLTSTSRSDDLGWSESFSIVTNTTFGIATDAFTFQENAVANSCVPGGACTWWVQGVVGVDSGALLGKPSGYYVHDAHIEDAYGPNPTYKSWCPMTASKYINIDQHGMKVVEQITNASNDMTLALIVENINGSIFVNQSNPCPTPQGQTPLDFVYQIEGVVAGCGNILCWTNTSFSPLSSNIFGGNITFVSNHNTLGMSNLSTQTGEGSNLYQEWSVGYWGSEGSKAWVSSVFSSFLYQYGGDETKTDTNPPPYPLEFTESGLPSNSKWCVTMDLTKTNEPEQCSWGTSMWFFLFNSSQIPYQVGNAQCGDGCQGIPSPASGHASGGSGHQVAITYSLQYYLTMSESGDGTVTPSSGWQNAGSQPTITAAGNCGQGLTKGWTFQKWTGQGAGSYTGFDSSYKITMSSDVNETATFTYGYCPLILNG